MPGESWRANPGSLSWINKPLVSTRLELYVYEPAYIRPATPSLYDDITWFIPMTTMDEANSKARLPVWARCCTSRTTAAWRTDFQESFVVRHSTRGTAGLIRSLNQVQVSAHLVNQPFLMLLRLKRRGAQPSPLSKRDTFHLCRRAQPDAAGVHDPVLGENAPDFVM